MISRYFFAWAHSSVYEQAFHQGNWVKDVCYGPCILQGLVELIISLHPHTSLAPGIVSEEEA